jgi:hypothetical protein
LRTEIWYKSHVKHKQMMHKLPTFRLLFSFSRPTITLFKPSKTPPASSSSRRFNSICSRFISEFFSFNSLHILLSSLEVCQQKRWHDIPTKMPETGRKHKMQQNKKCSNMHHCSRHMRDKIIPKFENC